MLLPELTWVRSATSQVAQTQTQVSQRQQHLPAGSCKKSSGKETDEEERGALDDSHFHIKSRVSHLLLFIPCYLFSFFLISFFSHKRRRRKAAAQACVCPLHPTPTPPPKIWSVSASLQLWFKIAGKKRERMRE